MMTGPDTVKYVDPVDTGLTLVVTHLPIIVG